MAPEVNVPSLKTALKADLAPVHLVTAPPPSEFCHITSLLVALKDASDNSVTKDLDENKILSPMTLNPLTPLSILISSAAIEPGFPLFNKLPPLPPAAN